MAKNQEAKTSFYDLYRRRKNGLILTHAYNNPKQLELYYCCSQRPAKLLVKFQPFIAFEFKFIGNSFRYYIDMIHLTHFFDKLC